MRYRIWTFLLAFVLAMSACQVLRAQTADNLAESVRHELQLTDELIGRAREATRASNNPLAEQKLHEAIQLQEQAWGAFRERRYLLASKLTRWSRDAAKGAVSTCRQMEQLEGVVLRKLERAGELLERVREYISPQNDQTLGTVLGTVKDNLVRAWEFYRDRQYRPALKLADQVEKAAHKLINAARLSDRAAVTFERRRENVERLLQQARESEADCASEAGRTHLKQAEKALQTACDMYDQRHLRAALQALKRAREAALRGIRQCRQSFEMLLHRYERLRSEADLAIQQLQEAEKPETGVAAKLIEQAHEQLDLAHEYIAKENIEQALASLQAAQLALRQAQRYITDGF